MPVMIADLLGAGKLVRLLPTATLPQEAIGP